MLTTKNSLIPFILTFAVSFPVFANDDCEATVDMADSLDFHKMHVDCVDDPVTIYDPKSKDSFFSKKKDAVTTYQSEEQSSSQMSVKPAEQSDTVVEQPITSAAVADRRDASGNAGVVFNIREPFTVTGGPHSAIMGLYVQMANYCPQGWKKLEEWVRPSPNGYFLHYQFQCSE